MDTVATADDGKPMWAPSRRSSAEEGAQRAFERNGEAFGAHSVDQFVSRPTPSAATRPRARSSSPARTATLCSTTRSGNVFAVASKEGASQTMLKPDDGMAYWEKQKDREARSQTARRSRASDDQA